jgi:hypothetical protein
MKMSRVCKKCGGTVKAEDSFCMHCGMPLEKEEPFKEETIKENENKTDVLSVWDYLLMLIILAIPVVNIIVCIFCIIGKSGNPNRRNFAKAWMILAVAGTLLSGLLSYGLFQFLVMDNYVDWEHHIEYSIPEEQFIDGFLSDLNEV